MSKNWKHWYEEDDEEFDMELPKVQRIKRKPKYTDESKQPPKDEPQQ